MNGVYKFVKKIENIQRVILLPILSSSWDFQLITSLFFKSEAEYPQRKYNLFFISLKNSMATVKRKRTVSKYVEFFSNIYQGTSDFLAARLY